MKEVNISERERQVLVYLAKEWSSEQNCFYMRSIAKETGLDIPQVRRSVRSLARKGLAEYVRGLFDGDGQVAGSGYCATKAGAVLVSGCIDCKVEVADMTDGRCFRCWENRKCTKCGKPYHEHELVNGHRKEFEFPE